MTHPLSIFVLMVVALLVPPTWATSRGGFHDIAPKGIRVDLFHVDYGGNFTKLELLQRAIKRGKHRLERLKAGDVLAADDGSDELQAPVHAGNGEFLINLSIGTPTVPFSAIVDTGSDLIWTQCKPCTSCYNQPTPIFDPSKSSSYSNLPCSSSLCKALPTSTCSPDCEYLYAYGDYSTTQGVLASETFTFGSKITVPHIGFGCGDDNEGKGFSQGAGLVGLGWGPLSLISQLGAGKFSYCLTSLDDSKTSPLFFGSTASFGKGLKVGSTPLIKNPSQPTFYYLSLEGITVGGTLLSIPKSTFALKDDGSGGLIIDSGTSITYLEEVGYKLVRKAFVSQVQLEEADASSTGLDLCFSLPSDASTVEVPKLVFHFNGADLDLPAENYMILDSSTGLLCLTIMDSTGMSIFGNFQQQNLQFVYDLQKETLSFAPVQCDQL
ncbi:aspartic proteinase nepenthesin-2 [Magnolia sinica]|uniref:aspartic proteinase nepenthesin-2 n=1 Tax=Magnolia sinica TaxID=86752 RepID=UPI002659A9A7|nr:aspartic proteinase nepenthesin-2 [Magnolia sinica]